jgi:hypothetical protein
LYQGPSSTLANTNQRRPLYLQNPTQGGFYGIISQGAPYGTGSYNALYLSVQKRLSHGVNILANYTWSHCISDEWNGQPGNNGVSSVTPGNRRSDRSNCAPNLVTSDQRQLFNLSLVYQTPKFSGKALRLLASDWQLAPIVNIKSAQYYTVTLGQDVALNGETAQQRPNLVSNVNPYDTSGVACPGTFCVPWNNRTAFATPATGSLGNLGIGNLAGPGVFQLDLALSRRFRITEKQALQVRGEAFNLPNHTNFSVPNSALNGGTFGTITSDISGTSGLSSGDYRVVQFALKYIF